LVTHPAALTIISWNWFTFYFSYYKQCLSKVRKEEIEGSTIWRMRVAGNRIPSFLSNDMYTVEEVRECSI
jgi:hypothetical protein